MRVPPGAALLSFKDKASEGLCKPSDAGTRDIVRESAKTPRYYATGVKLEISR